MSWSISMQESFYQVHANEMNGSSFTVGWGRQGISFHATTLEQIILQIISFVSMKYVNLPKDALNLCRRHLSQPI